MKLLTILPERSISPPPILSIQILPKSEIIELPLSVTIPLFPPLNISTKWLALIVPVTLSFESTLFGFLELTIYVMIHHHYL